MRKDLDHNIWTRFFLGLQANLVIAGQLLDSIPLPFGNSLITTSVKYVHKNLASWSCLRTWLNLTADNF
jgi:hypothetical protein